MEYKYTLQRYAGPDSKHICPSCGRRSFKLYVDASTNAPIDASCGLCDHIQSCGYHLPPKDFFASHPEFNGSATTVNPLPDIHKPVIPALSAPMPVFASPLDSSYVIRSAVPSSTFHAWLRVLGIFPEKIIHPLGSTKAGEVIFWLIDANQSVLDGKVILYDSCGHRVHQPEGSSKPDVSWISTFLKRQHVIDWSAQTRKCFFGENLLSSYPDLPVNIVESEKSAVVLQHLYPSYLWLATGGCSMLRNLDLSPLRNRHVTIFPDAGMLFKWQDFFRSQTIISNYRFYTALESYPPNTDLVDTLVPDISPAVFSLAQSLDLTMDFSILKQDGASAYNSRKKL